MVFDLTRNILVSKWGHKRANCKYPSLWKKNNHQIKKKKQPKKKKIDFSAICDEEFIIEVLSECENPSDCRIWDILLNDNFSS